MSSKKLPAGWADDVLHFWFEELSEKDWFRGSTHVDDKCRSRFGDLGRRSTPEELEFVKRQPPLV